MKRIDEEKIKSIDDLQDELDDGACILQADNQDCLIVLDYQKYQFLVDMLAGEMPSENKQIGIRVVSDQDIDLSEEEFESLKNQLVEALEANFYHKNKKKEEMN